MVNWSYNNYAISCSAVLWLFYCFESGPCFIAAIINNPNFHPKFAFVLLRLMLTDPCKTLLTVANIDSSCTSGTLRIYLPSNEVWIISLKRRSSRIAWCVNTRLTVRQAGQDAVLLRRMTTTALMFWWKLSGKKLFYVEIKNWQQFTRWWITDNVVITNI